MLAQKDLARDARRKTVLAMLARKTVLAMLARRLPLATLASSDSPLLKGEGPGERFRVFAFARLIPLS
jgi:hypothetical protein